MQTVFLLQNQHQHLLSKQGEWVDGRDANALFRTVHRDEALNQMIEANSRDYTLRIRILESEVNERGRPLLKEEDLPPLGELSAAEATAGHADMSVDAESGSVDADSGSVNAGADTDAETLTEPA